jgi:zinc/manganese transport system ATP-binding protein
MTAIRFENLTLGYGRHPAVHHLDAELASGSLTAIVGPNGAGKSTLLKGIVGALKPLDGRVRFGSSARAPNIAYLPQLAELDRDFPLSVHELVKLGLWRHIGLFGSARPYARQVAHAIAAVGLTGFEARPISTLSGGQLQRALFARLLVQDAPLIVLDEPFNSMDTRTASDLMRMVQRWHGEARTVIVVLHDMNLVREQFPNAMLIARELIDVGATADVLCAENLLRARQLHEAFDEDASVCEVPDDQRLVDAA